MITPMQKIGLDLENLPLKKVIKQTPGLTKEKIKELYGDIGVDIFEGKEKISILTYKDNKKNQNILDKLINWLYNNKKFEYEENDSIRNLVNKYACNNLCATYEDIEKKFGKEGIRIANIYKVMGWLRTGF